MTKDISGFIESTKFPNVDPWMNNVIYVFANGIPEDCYSYCKEECNTETDDVRQYLSEFVRIRLKKLAVNEYHLWINGRIPYITPRELQLWRLRQFVQYIWFWNLPEDEDLAMIFNATKRKASNLINDFIARFRKTLLFPIALRRLYNLLMSEPEREELSHYKKPDVLGDAFLVINQRYVDDCNMLIYEIRTRLTKNYPITDSFLYDKDEKLMWVDKAVLNIIRTNDDIMKEIFDNYPEPSKENE